MVISGHGSANISTAPTLLWPDRDTVLSSPTRTSAILATVALHITVQLTVRTNSLNLNRHNVCIPNLITVPLQPSTYNTVKQQPVSAKLTTLKMALINARSVRNKKFILRDFFSSNMLDFLFLTETWLKGEENVVMNALCPSKCKYISDPRPSGRGGGLATVFNEQFSCRSVDIGAFNSFEVHMFKIGTCNPFYSILIYRIPGPDSGFLTEFAEFLSSVVVKYSQVLCSGDFNIHVDVASDKFAMDFLHLTESFNLT